MLDAYKWHLTWHKLVHVCRRWRFIIFGSPHHLKLKLVCTSKTPVRKLLDIWPAFPLAVYVDGNEEDEFDDLFAALEHRDRVKKIEIGDPLTRDGLWERMATVMEEPFPELTYLWLGSPSGVLPLSNTFLSGSASRLQHLVLWSISFPSLPQFLLSTRDLTTLNLFDIPNSGYIPPERMATCLSVLPKLESVIIQFESPTPNLERGNRSLPPQTRSVLPSLTELDFRGMSEYLEVLAARIDVPILRFDHLKIVFSNRLTFDIPQTIRLFGHLDSFRTSNLTLRFHMPWYSSRLHSEAVFFPSDMAPRSLACMGQSCSWHIRCNTSDGQVFSMAQICRQILSFHSSVESLIIECNFPPRIEIDSTAWLELFRSFLSVKSLQIPAILELSIAAALQGLTGESAAEVFPSLHSLFIVGMSAGAVPQGMQLFLTARQDCGRPISVSRRRK
jgi:hypothetical protein